MVGFFIGGRGYFYAPLTKAILLRKYGFFFFIIIGLWLYARYASDDTINMNEKNAYV